MKNYEYILLDWDGNLAQTIDLWIEAYRITLNEEGYFPKDEEISGAFGRLREYLLSLGIEDPEAVYERADELGRKKLPQVELYPDALEVLRYLKDINKMTGLVTTSRPESIGHLLDRHDMHQFFDVIVTYDDVENHKPHPESLIKALEALGGNKDEAIMIGDSDTDLGAAANAGIDSLLFFPPEHTKFYDLEALKQLKPTYVVDDFRKVMDIVKHNELVSAVHQG